MKEFSAQLYRICSQKEGNVFLSPFCVSAALLLADLASMGETDIQIRNSQGAASISKENLLHQYKSINNIIFSGIWGSTTLATANKIFTDLSLRLDNTFQIKAKKYFGSGVESLDFTENPEESRLHINKWVKVQTRNKINDILPPGSIGPLSAQMILTSAIYFKGNWKTVFDKDNTEKAIFHTSKDATVEVDMMTDVRHNVRYYKDDEIEYSAVELPYADSNIAMVFVLPDEIGGLSRLELRMAHEFLMNVFDGIGQAGSMKVIIGIPKFTLEIQYNLKEILQSLGLYDMFNPETADFSAMLSETSQDNRNPYVSDVVHKTFLEVNEEGTEAAALAAMLMPIERDYRPPTPVARFIADHPFIFFIKETTTDTILFLGRYSNPYP